MSGIVVFPMLVSNTVNPNLIPGVSKVIEKFLLVNRLDVILKGSAYIGSGAAMGDIITTARTKARRAALSTVAGPLSTVLPDGKIETIDTEDLLLEQPGNVGPFGGKKQSDEDLAAIIRKQKSEIDKLKKSSGEKDTKESKGVSFDFKANPSFETISLEPTWVTVERRYGSELLGVKVVPFEMQTDESFISLLKSDSGKMAKRFNFMLNVWKRSVRSMLYRNYIKFINKIPLIRDFVMTGALSGQPKDIIFTATIYGENISLMLNKADIPLDIFRPANIQRLHRLQWSYLIFSDEVNRRTTFCMRNFHGLCTTMPNNFLYAGVGSRTGKLYTDIYNDLMDVKKSISPFF